MRSRSWRAALTIVGAAALPLLVAQVSSADTPGLKPKVAGRASASASASASGSASASASAAPATTVNAEIMVLFGSNDGSGIDPKLKSVPQLGKPPFTAYNSYKLLGQSRAPLVVGKPMETALPNGRKLQVTLKESAATGRHKVSTSINQPGGADFLPLLEVTTSVDEPFFVAGQSHKNGILVVGIRLVKLGVFFADTDARSPARVGLDENHA